MRWYSTILVLVALFVGVGSFLVAEQLRRPTPEGLGVCRGMTLKQVVKVMGPPSHHCLMGSSSFCFLGRWDKHKLQVTFNCEFKVVGAQVTASPTTIERAWNWLREWILPTEPDPFAATAASGSRTACCHGGACEAKSPEDGPQARGA